MRKLQRPPLHHRELPLRLTGKGPSLTRALIAGFVVAFFFHALLFYLADFSRSKQTPSLPAPRFVTVTTEIAPPRGSRAALLPQLEKEPPLFAGYETGALPDLPSELPLEIDRHLNYAPLPAPSLSSFENLEEFQDEFAAIDFNIPTRKEPVKLTVSGPLAELKLKRSALIPINRKLKNSKRLPLQQLTYRVKVSSESGRLFWYELEEKNGKSEIEILAESLLQHLLFEKSDSSFATEGIIEIHISADPTGKLSDLMADLDEFDEVMR